MSEEILRALMELFAIIIKQDGGLSGKEKSYVKKFLVQQIGVESAEEYFELFLETARSDQEEDGEKKRLTSVLDSVKILKIGKKISKTLNQQQKVVVLIRSMELVNTEYKLTGQRVEIVETLADVFRIKKEEYTDIYNFVTADRGPAGMENLLLIHPPDNVPAAENRIIAEGADREMYILRVPSVELYFLKYDGKLEVLLNGHPVIPGTIYILANGSSIRFPSGLPIYYSDITANFLSRASDEKVALQAERISYSFPGQVKGLREISFYAEQGNMIGIMGASGSGKTTLLNVLSGMYTPSTGVVKVNGRDINADDELLRGVMGYVPQDDLLVEELTVFENLWFNAKFCFRDLDEEEIRARVERVLDNLGLLEKKDLKVGSVMNKTISGGQRKRLNIALELIREPAILFLDEPTSGLSSRDSENVMDLLRELTTKGKLIFNVIHQPSSELYKMFDRVIILDEGGYMVWYGNPVEAVVHFRKIDNQVNYGIGECPVCGNVNPEQLFNILEARQVDEFGNYTSQRKISPARWKGYFEESRHPEPQPASGDKPPVRLKLPHWGGQLVNYLRRDLRSKTGNRQYMSLVLGVSPLLAIILSYIIRYIADPTSNRYIFRENENIPIYIFMAIIVALFLGLIMSAEEIFRDRKILKREKFLHLSRSAYLSAKVINIFLMSALQTIIFVLIANNVLGIRQMTFSYFFALFSVSACANMIGLIISSAFDSAVTIYILIPLVMIPMMVLSGAMFSFEKLNRNISSVGKVPAIAEVMPTRWAYEALMVRQFKDNAFEQTFFDVEMEISQNNFKSAWYIPELEQRLDEVRDEFFEKGRVVESEDALRVLENEIMREQDSLEGWEFDRGMFDPGNFSDDFGGRIDKFLEELNDFYLGKFVIANNRKQRILQEVMKDQKALYYELLDKYHNESVSDQVRKIYEKNKIVESDGRLYQQTDPIFLLPEATRAHFYAPRKLIFGSYVDTYWFNMGVIWLITVILYMVLYYDLLKKVVHARYFRKRVA